jgi:hypothetical protein
VTMSTASNMLRFCHVIGSARAGICANRSAAHES